MTCAPPIEKTQERAQRLIGTRAIRYLGGTRFSIEGQATKRTQGEVPLYEVDILRGTCTCPARFRPCKHTTAFGWLREIIVQVNASLARQALPSQPQGVQP